VPTIRPHDSSLPGDRACPAPVELLLGGTWRTATAHAVRHSRRGQQVLVGVHGRLVWVSASRIRPSESSGSQTSQRETTATPIAEEVTDHGTPDPPRR
jgi:hypothetical protein